MNGECHLSSRERGNGDTCMRINTRVHRYDSFKSKVNSRKGIQFHQHLNFLFLGKTYILTRFETFSV